MRAPVVLESLVAEYLRSRFSYYALGLGVLVTYVGISQDFIIGYQSADGAHQDLSPYVRQILFHVIALYWAFVASLAADRVLLEEIGDGSIDMVLTSREKRSRYVLERAVGTLVAVLPIVVVASCVAALIDVATGDTPSVSLVLAPVCLLPCLALIVSLCALLSTSGLNQKVGPAAFLVYIAVWFFGSGWFEGLWGPSVDRLVCYVLPNVWEWQKAMGKVFAGKSLSWMNAWALASCCMYTAAFFVFATSNFKKRDL